MDDEQAMRLAETLGADRTQLKGIGIGSPSTSPPAAATRRMAARMSSTPITTDGCCAGHWGLRP